MKTIVLNPAAARAFDRLPPDVRARIADALHACAIGRGGDTKAMRGTPTVRLRVGDYRVIFDEAATAITVLAVGIAGRSIDSGAQRSARVKVQTIETESGEDLVVISRRDYDALLARAGDEEAEDRMTLVIAAEARAAEPLPEPVSSAILAGDSVLKALRRWRGLTQVDLAAKAGLTQSYLSELEQGAKEGSPDTLARLARGLGVPEGWLG